MSQDLDALDSLKRQLRSELFDLKVSSNVMSLLIT